MFGWLMIKKKSRIYILFVILAVFAVPGVYSVVNLEHHQYICKFDCEDNTNENYISHCDKCYFYFDELASNTYHYLESNHSPLLKFRNYADNIFLTNNHFYIQGRSPPLV